MHRAGRIRPEGDLRRRGRSGGIRRATLYRHPELHAIVHEHRQRAAEAFTLTGLAVQIDQLRKSVEAVAAKVRRHEEQLRKLSRASDKRTG